MCSVAKWNPDDFGAIRLSSGRLLLNLDIRLRVTTGSVSMLSMQMSTITISAILPASFMLIT
jgi:hypothetical protein